MSRIAALFLQITTVLVGIGVLVFMLWEPHVEGRNAHATVFQIYFCDPFLAYVYMGSTPFFAALYFAFGLFHDVRVHGAWSQTSVVALKRIMRCAIVLIGFVLGGGVLIFLFGDKDDRPVGFVMSFFFICVACTIALTASLAARKLRQSLSLTEFH